MGEVREWRMVNREELGNGREGDTAENHKVEY